jgi:hypothetical protein
MADGMTDRWLRIFIEWMIKTVLAMGLMAVVVAAAGKGAMRIAMKWGTADMAFDVPYVTQAHALMVLEGAHDDGDGGTDPCRS